MTVNKPMAICYPRPKTPTVHSEAYRRLVAALPCVRCGIQGASQAAHPNSDKAKGKKADDRECFPLCAARPMAPGCHFLFDQHHLFARGERSDIERNWGKRTRERILAAGKWPADLPLWSEE
jgi:hypothetical protein